MPRRVLVVDDYEDARELLGLILAHVGFEVLLAANGADAVAIAQRERPDIVVMDLFMPGMDGIEATRRIKADPTVQHMPVIAYTARTTPLGDTDQQLFSGVCIKPCSPDRLIEMLNGALEAA
jgi:two-component system, cell cycle response regulator DivK